MNSSRTDSQRLDVTNGHQHCVDASNSRLCRSPNLPCSLKALTEVRPCIELKSPMNASLGALQLRMWSKFPSPAMLVLLKVFLHQSQCYAWENKKHENYVFAKKVAEMREECIQKLLHNLPGGFR